MQYTASLSRSQGRSAWSIIFRHPLRNDRQGRPGLRVRRGLGTSDQTQAQALVDQMNELLRTEELWKPGLRAEALKRYDEVIVAAFYDDIEPIFSDPWDTRDQVIPLPETFHKVQMIGTTGAGKTTVVRQLIGTNPDSEYFPSTSTAKTTIADTEIVLTDAPFRAVVTFRSQFEVGQHIEDCVAAAVMAAYEGAKPDESARKLLEHREQRFRLRYLLGSFAAEAGTDAEEDESAEEEDTPRQVESEVSAEERAEFERRLRGYLSDIAALAEAVRAKVSAGLDTNVEDLRRREDKDVFQELVEDELYDHSSFHELVMRLLDEVKQRFSYQRQGQFTNDADGWPKLWTWETADRAAFIREVRRFSSNYAPNFGKLLSPLVNGMRIAGPFKPEWGDGSIPPLVVMDSEGLGHTPDSTSSLSTSVTRRFHIADTILLVDNAMNPMQAAPGAVLSSVATNGHAKKLAVAFTHFDQVRGDNLPTPTAKREHVRGSLDNMIGVITAELGRGAELAFRRDLESRIFFLANIQKLKVKGPTEEEFRRLLKTMSPEPPTPAEQHDLIPLPGPEEAASDEEVFTPTFDEARLVWYIQKAIQEFREQWRARLGLDYRPGVDKVHWASVKALTRYVSTFGWDEYNSLRPVADLLQYVVRQVNVFLRNECRWRSDGAIDDDGVAYVARQTSAQLLPILRKMLIANPVDTWRRAYTYRGRGSTVERAVDIDSIYRGVAPLLTEMSSIASVPLELEVRRIVRQAFQTYAATPAAEASVGD